MDVVDLDRFLNYRPFMKEDVQELVDEIKNQASYYLSQDKLDTIQRTYEFAHKAHGDDKRLSGEVYIVHPLKATLFLMKIKPDLESIQACILHDVIEDTSVTYEDVKSNFGPEVANLCDGLVKVAKVRYEGEDRQLETLKKTFLAMGKDLRVIFIKLADRIHNIQTLHFHPKPEKRERIAKETLKVYVPIAQRLGLAVFQGFLENGAFRILNEKEFKRIFRYVKNNFGSGEKYIDRGVKRINSILKKSGVEIDFISGRIKSPYRIHKKLQKYNTRDISKVMDVIAFRIVTNSIQNCYSTMGTIHSYYTPIIKKIKDYIAVPKSNGYQSLHTTILGMFVFPVEIQIRTQEMDYLAEYGVAAHFAYKEFGEASAISDSQSEWIRKLQDIVNTYQSQPDKEGFKDELQIEVLNKNIFVYTPQGEIVELPSGSTVLDFAFKIHTDVGLKFKNALVNNRIVPKDYRLNNGDFIKIQTFRNKYSASSSWISSLHTPSAKDKLNRYLRYQEKEKYIQHGQDILNEKLKYFKLPLLNSKDDLIGKFYKGEDQERILMKIGSKNSSPNKIIKEFYENKIKPSDQEESDFGKNDQVQEVKEKINNMVIVDIDKKINYDLCPECNPTPGDKVIAKSGKEGMKIHKLSCDALKRVSYDKLLEAHWSGENPNIYKLKLTLKILDKPGALLQVLNIFQDLNVNVSDISVYSQDEESSKVLFYLDFKNPSKIPFVIKELKNKENLIKKISKKLVNI